MLRLHVVQAEYGDCLILESGTPSKRRYMLIDGGPGTIYERHLRGHLREIAGRGERLDLVVLSHVDNDHIIGLLDLMAELRQQRADGTAETIGIDALWHNAFSQAIGSGNDIGNRLKTVLVSAGAAGQTMALAGMAVEGIGEGHRLRLAAAALGIPVNPGFPHDLVSADDAPETVVLDDLRLRVVGPTKRNLEELKREWLDWLDRHEDEVASGDPLIAARADRSIPNLSSIMVMAEAGGKRILLTGDGRGDHLLQGLQQADLLDGDGRLHVDVLKVPHHGSERNVTRNFFKAVTADTYVISANGRHENPSLSTLIWIGEAAREQGRAVEILLTNETPATRQFLEEYDPRDYRYRVTMMEKRSHSKVLEIVP